MFTHEKVGAGCQCSFLVAGSPLLLSQGDVLPDLCLWAQTSFASPLDKAGRTLGLCWQTVRECGLDKPTGTSSQSEGVNDRPKHDFTQIQCGKIIGFTECFYSTQVKGYLEGVGGVVTPDICITTVSIHKGCRFHEAPLRTNLLCVHRSEKNNFSIA